MRTNLFVLPLPKPQPNYKNNKMLVESVQMAKTLGISVKHFPCIKYLEH